MRTTNPNRLSLMLLFTIVSLGLIWIFFSKYAAPLIIQGAYHGHSLPFLNRMIAGQAHHALAEYLSDWKRFSWRVLVTFFMFGFFLMLMMRPEIQRTLWGREEKDRKVPRVRENPFNQRGAHLAALVLYLAIAVVFTLPNSLHPTRTLLGAGDNVQHAWFLWAFAKALVHGHNPFFTDLLLYPFGVNLAWATTDPLGGIIALPLSLTAGPVITYNLSIILQLALSALFARFLCFRITGNAGAATIGGMIFGFSPLLLGHAAMGHLSLVTAFPLPLYVLALENLVEEEHPTWKEGGLLGLALLLTALASYQGTLFCLMFTTVVLGIDLGLDGIALLKRLWVPLLVSAATFLVCFSPLLAMLLLKEHGAKPLPIEGFQNYSADLLGFFVPRRDHIFLSQYVRKLPREFFADTLEGRVFTGLVAPLLAAVGFWAAKGQQRRWASRIMIVGIVFAALSLGPTVRILGRATDLPAPGEFLYKIEFARYLREPARLDIMTTLCLSLLASLGLLFFVDKLQRRWQKFLLLGIAGLSVALEYLGLPFPSSSIIDPALDPVSVATTQRCSLPPTLRDCTVLTVPLFQQQWGNGNEQYWKKSMWMQIMDGGRYRLVEGYVGVYVPERVWAGFNQMPILGFLRKGPMEPVVPLSDRGFAGSLVRNLNLCAIVVFDPSERPSELNYVRKVFRGKESTVDSCVVLETASDPEDSSEAKGTK